jgi:hypothetical protein
MNENTKQAVAAFVAISGLVGLVATIFSFEEPLRTWSFAALFATVAGISAWYFLRPAMTEQRAKRALPEVGQLDELCAGYRTAPATEQEVGWISELEKSVYSVADAVPGEVLHEWYASNPTGFTIIRMGNGTKIGHIDILPLRPKTLDSFLDGKIVERDIRGDSLYAPAERDQIRDLYVESIIVQPPKGYSNAPAVLCVLGGFANLVERICDPERVRTVYAIAASHSGERFLHRLGFDQLRGAATRKDGHNLFSVDYPRLRENIITICSSRFPETPLAESPITV